MRHIITLEVETESPERVTQEMIEGARSIPGTSVTKADIAEKPLAKPAKSAKPAKPAKSQVRLHMVLARFVDNEGMPEVLLCWDEYCIEGNPDGWAEARAKAMVNYGTGSDVVYRDVTMMSVGLPEVFDVPEVSGEVE